MNELFRITLFSIIGTIASLSIIIVFIKKKKTHKDFLLVVMTFSFFTLLCLFIGITGLVDIIKNGQNPSVNGLCTIVRIDSVGGRFSTDTFYQVIIDDLTIEADAEDFAFLKEGTYQCTVQYGLLSHRLIDINYQK